MFQERNLATVLAQNKQNTARLLANLRFNSIISRRYPYRTRDDVWRGWRAYHQAQVSLFFFWLVVGSVWSVFVVAGSPGRVACHDVNDWHIPGEATTAILIRSCVDQAGAI